MYVKRMAQILGLSLSGFAFCDAASTETVKPIVQSGFFLGGSVGGIFPMDDKNGNDDQVFGGAKLGYQFDEYWRVQMNSGFSKDYNFVVAEGVFQLPISRYFTPYVSLGIGELHMNGNTMFAPIDAGAGVSSNIFGGFSVSLDYRYIQAIYSQTPMISALSFGVSYRFGASDQNREMELVDRIKQQNKEIRYLDNSNQYLNKQNQQLHQQNVVQPIQIIHEYQATEKQQTHHQQEVQTHPDNVIYTDLTQPESKRQYYAN